MSTLRCVELTNKYPGQHGYALGGPDGGVSFDVAEGELFALLGPSGCGKTTTLRIVGGFVQPSSGRVEVAGVDLTAKPPYARPINTVFQSYALFPHLTVGANVEFGLRMDRVGRSERRSRAADALASVGMAEMTGRRVAQLSGGQQQRVALARAMVKRPTVLLLDEPFGALDLRLRRQMQDELARLKGATSTTFVHVTHDQEEACAIADRIAVMNDGNIVQVDSPVGLYRAPRTDFIAEFLSVGTVLRGRSVCNGPDVRVETAEMAIHAPTPPWAAAGTKMCAVIPPDRITIVDPSHPHCPESQYVTATVDHLAFTGSTFVAHLQAGVAGTRLTANLAPDTVTDSLRPGASVVISWRHADVIVVEDTDSPLLAKTGPQRSSASASAA